MPSKKRSSIQRDLLLGVVITALVFACALIFGGPFLTASSASAASAVSALPAQTQTTTVNGTVKQNGDQVYLSEASSGKTYRLDHQQGIRPFAGRFVTVTGELNSQSMLIHVEKIETIDA
jgi:hypothetical protein